MEVLLENLILRTIEIPITANKQKRQKIKFDKAPLPICKT